MRCGSYPSLVVVVQVVVMTVDIVSNERNKTNVLTYIFRYNFHWLLFYGVIIA